MNEKSTNNMNPEDEKIAKRLNEVAEQTHANAQFAAELEERLRTARQRNTNWLASSFKQLSPALRWAVLMILLAVALSWSIKTLVPAPQPAADDTPVVSDTIAPTLDVVISPTPPSSNEGAYDFRGAQLYLEQPLPDSPGQAHIYLLKKDEPATEEQARALADRLGIQGQIYTAPGLIYGTTDYVVSNGKQFLQVHSDRYFMYTSNIAKNNRNTKGTPSDDAEVIIREFLRAHGFDFNVRVSADAARGGYNVKPLAPDSIPMQYESFTQPVIHITLDENEDVLSMSASLMDYDPNPIGEYEVITAEQALQRLLDDNRSEGKIEFFHSSGRQFQDWYRDHPDNQTVTIYANVTSNPTTDPNQPALILIEGVPAVGNTAGMEKLDPSTFTQATGQYFIEGDIRKFNVESWRTGVESTYLTGILHREGDQIILTTDDGSGKEYLLVDPPADAPLDTEMGVSQLSIEGVIIDGKMEWRFIRYDEDLNQSGGGGGGGAGFYQLNLSGMPVVPQTVTPIPNPTMPTTDQGTVEYVVQEGDTLFAISQAFWTTPEKIAEVNGFSDGDVLRPGMTIIIPDIPGVLAGLSPLGKQIEGLRGNLSITIYRNPDGSERTEYSLIYIPTENAYSYMSFQMLLEGSGLESLKTYQNRPIEIWGTISGYNQQTLMPIVSVERFNIPFPNLEFQILRGTQTVTSINGQDVILFTTEEGVIYVQSTGVGEIQYGSIIGNPGDKIVMEGLVIPDESLGGYPLLRAFNYGIDTGQPDDITITADQPYLMDELILPDVYTQPNLKIGQVELVYFVSNPYYQVNDPNYSERSLYIQPVWHFHGRYDNGTEFDVLIQALKQDFLLPELAPGLSPG